MSKLWNTLEHNGVKFPDVYTPLPESVKILYKGKPVSLDSKNKDNKFNISAEEAIYLYSLIAERDKRFSEEKKNYSKWTDDEKLNENFWSDWKQILGSSSKIKDFSLVDVSPIINYLQNRKAKLDKEKKSLSKEEKQEIKKKKEEEKQKYGYAVIDGEKVAIGNVTVQPPQIFIGHGKHPLRGRIKARIKGSEIVLNGTKLPKGPWKTVNDPYVTYLAYYTNPLTKEKVHINLSRNESKFVKNSDRTKFEKARTLKENMSKIREKYTQDMGSENQIKRELATATYLLDVIAIRPGTEKDEKTESDTKGLTTLTCENISFGEDKKITLNFMGKSSIPFIKTFTVTKLAYKNLKSLCENKKGSKKLFKNVDATTLNGYLKTLLPNLTAKVFRTYKSSSILQSKLNENMPSVDAPVHEKKIAFNQANVEAALALNHKKLSNDTEKQVTKLKDKLKELKKKRKEAKTDKQKETAEKNIKVMETKIMEAELNISTITSKSNYSDPRIIVQWAKKTETPIEQLYNKSQLTKFGWSMDTKSNWEF